MRSCQQSFELLPPSEKYDAERMWIRITSAQSDWLEGTVESQPRDMPKLLQGVILHLPRSYVIDVVLDDPARTPPAVKPKREYWARCIVVENWISLSRSARHD